MCLCVQQRAGKIRQHSGGGERSTHARTPTRITMGTIRPNEKRAYTYTHRRRQRKRRQPPKQHRWRERTTKISREQTPRPHRNTDRARERDASAPPVDDEKTRKKTQKWKRERTRTRDTGPSGRARPSPHLLSRLHSETKGPNGWGRGAAPIKTPPEVRKVERKNVEKANLRRTEGCNCAAVVRARWGGHAGTHTHNCDRPRWGWGCDYVITRDGNANV